MSVCGYDVYMHISLSAQGAISLPKAWDPPQVVSYAELDLSIQQQVLQYASYQQNGYDDWRPKKDWSCAGNSTLGTSDMGMGQWERSAAQQMGI